MCNEFIKVVRDSANKDKEKRKRKNEKIKLPNQREFKVQHWSNYFRASKSRTPLDERLYRAGLWFHKHSKPVREETIEVFENLLSTGQNENLLRLLVGMVNFRASEISQNHHNIQIQINYYKPKR